jgi:hypothetical protein
MIVESEIANPKSSQRYLKSWADEIFCHDARQYSSRKDAKHAKFGEIGRYFSLRSWRLGAKNFVEVVLSNILSVRI